jgi:hypothetical protein
MQLKAVLTVSAIYLAIVAVGGRASSAAAHAP